MNYAVRAPRNGICWLAFASMVAALPGAAMGQIVGVVVDSTGQPVVGASVELWGRSTLGVAGLSDNEGQFNLSPRPNATRVLAYAMGMDSAFAELGDLLQPVRIVLRPRPVILPGLSVEAVPFQCPRQDDSAARSLWRRVVASYNPLPDSVRWAAQIVRMSEGTGYPGEPIGRQGEPSMHGLTEGGSFGSEVPMSLVPWSEAWIRRHGYARRAKWGGIDRREDAWEYIPLDGRAAAHLESKAFADLQRFAFSGPPSDRTIVFCSSDTKKPGIQGRIMVNSADQVVRVEWKFVTPPPMENAAGEAEFSASARFLLPTVGTYRRRTPVGRYFQQTTWYGPWFVGDSTSVREFMEAHRGRQRNQ